MNVSRQAFRNSCARRATIPLDERIVTSYVGPQIDSGRHSRKRSPGYRSPDIVCGVFHAPRKPRETPGRASDHNPGGSGFLGFFML
jgi:hypothetical protein